MNVEEKRKKKLHIYFGVRKRHRQCLEVMVHVRKGLLKDLLNMQCWQK